MTATSYTIAAPRWRHFFPVAPSLSASINSIEALTYKPIIIDKEYLIQGARPIDPLVIDPNATEEQFQGGYRCSIEITATPQNGTARISANTLYLEYKPNPGFSGADSFSYRLVNALGQQSNAACVSIVIA